MLSSWLKRNASVVRIESLETYPVADISATGFFMKRWSLIPPKGRIQMSVNTVKEDELRDVGCLRLFWEFFKLGLFTIGGGMAMIPQMQSLMVDKNRWVTEDDIIDCIAVSQSLPGVIAINMATYIGFKKRKLAGAVASTIGVLLPSLIIIIAVTVLLRNISDNPYVQGALTGIEAAAAGMIGWSAYTIARRVVKNVFAAVLAIVAFFLITFLKVNAVWVILGAIVLGILYDHFTQRPEADGKEVE